MNEKKSKKTVSITPKDKKRFNRMMSQLVGGLEKAKEPDVECVTNYDGSDIPDNDPGYLAFCDYMDFVESWIDRDYEEPQKTESPEVRKARLHAERQKRYRERQKAKAQGVDMSQTAKTSKTAQNKPHRGRPKKQG